MAGARTFHSGGGVFCEYHRIWHGERLAVEKFFWSCTEALLTHALESNIIEDQLFQPGTFFQTGVFCISRLFKLT